MVVLRPRKMANAYLWPAVGLSTLGIVLGAILSQPPAMIALASSDDQESLHLAPPVAQVPSAPQGNNVIIGNTSVPIPWEQRGDRIGLADLPLMTHLGLDLQSTLALGQQPVLWFSDAATALPTWYGQGYRYLDLTDWATQQGWQLIPTAAGLRIQAPRGTVSSGRRGQHTGSDRLVLDVDRPVLWSFEETATTFTLTLQADASSQFDQSALTTIPGNVLKTLQISNNNGQMVIRGTFDETARPRAWSLANPNRVVVDISQTHLIPRDILWAPGVRWRQEYISVGSRSFPVYQLWLDLTSATTLQPIWANSRQLPGITPLATMAKNTQAFAAINAGFFNRNNQLPLGAIRSNGQWISGPILNRGAIAWNGQGRYAVSPLVLTHTLTSAQGSSWPISQINSGYVQAGIGLYTPAWGSTYTPITDGETLVMVSQNQVVERRTAEAAGTGAYAIPPQGYLLAFRSFNSAAQTLPVGTTITLTPDLRPSIFGELPYAVGGGPILVQNGQINANAKAEGFSDAFAAQAAPRSAIGVTPEGRLLLAAIHYSPGGQGPTLTETAQIMRQLGAQQALNLDGGTSASLYLGGTIINRHGSTVGRVHNGLGVFLNAP